MRKTVRLIVAMLLCSANAFAQFDQFKTDAYCVNKAIDAMAAQDFHEAEKCLYDELAENPDNGIAYFWLAHLKLRIKEYGRALSLVNKSLKLLPKKEKRYIAFGYDMSGDVYLNLNDTARAVEFFTKSIDLLPSVSRRDAWVSRWKRAKAYSGLGQYELSDLDYKVLIEQESEESKMWGYLGLGENALAQRRWEDAVNHFDKIVENEQVGWMAYHSRAQCYYEMKQYGKALDDAIKAMPWNRTMNLIGLISDRAFDLTISKLKEQSGGVWDVLIASLYRRAYRHAESITYLKKHIAQYGEDSNTLLNMVNSYLGLGANEKALVYCDKVLALESLNASALIYKAISLCRLGKVNEAIALADRYINLTADNAGFWWRGYFRYTIRDIDGAIEDFTTGLAVNPDDVILNLWRAHMHTLKGEKALEQADYKRVIELSKREEGSSASFAYLALGQKREAIENMDKVLSEKPHEAKNYYAAACLYSRMGNYKWALNYLQMAFEKGYRDFFRIDNDDDMDALRDSPQFKEMVLKYKEMARHEVEKLDAVDKVD